VTSKKTIITKQDGSKEVTEESMEDGRKVENKYILGPGQSDPSGKGRLKY
jgi:hypothetical protein